MVTKYGKNLQNNEIRWGNEYCFRYPADCGCGGDGRVFDCGRCKAFAPEKRSDILGCGLLVFYVGVRISLADMAWPSAGEFLCAKAWMEPDTY